MQLFSEEFKKLVNEYLIAPNNLIATITRKDDQFTAQVKSRKDVELIEITPDNREEMYRYIKRRLE